MTSEKIAARLVIAREELAAAEAAMAPARRNFAASVVAGVKLKVTPAEEARARLQRAQDCFHGLEELQAQATHSELCESINAFGAERRELSERWKRLAAERTKLEQVIGAQVVESRFNSSDQNRLLGIRSQMSGIDSDLLRIDDLVRPVEARRAELEERFPFIVTTP